MIETLLLGATGFIGSAIKAELVRRRASCRSLGSKDLDLTLPDSPDKLRELWNDDTIVVLASRVSRSMPPWEQFRQNAAIATHAAQALAARRPRLFVLISSSSVYGTAATDLAVTEATAVNPESPYAVSKFCGERLLSHAASQSGASLLILRPGMVYGPGDTSTAYGPTRLIRSYLALGEVRLYGDGSELRDNLYVEDLARTAVELAETGARGIFNVGCGVPVSFSEIVAALTRLTGKPVRVIAEPRLTAKVDQRLVIDKLLNALPETKFTDLAAGLKQSCRYFSGKNTANAEKD